MRLAGSLINIDPSSIPQYGDRWAGQVIKENPDLVERVTAGLGIVPAGQQPAGEQVASSQA